MTEAQEHPGVGAMARDHQQHPEDNVGDLAGRLAEQIGELIRQEVTLAKADVRMEAQKVQRAGGFLGGAVAAGFLSLLLVSFALVYLLVALGLTSWGGFLILAIVFGAVALALRARGRQAAAAVQGVPDRTVERLKEDVEYLRDTPPGTTIR